MPRIGVFGVFLVKFLVLACLLPIGYVQATVYYVDQKNPAASDTNPGTKGAPWLSLYPTTNARFLPGDMVLVKAGIYRSNADRDKHHAMINPQHSGQSGRPIIFKSSPAFAATIEGASDLLAPVQIVNQNHVAIEGFRIVNPGKNGILIKGGKNKPVDGVAVRNNIIIHEQGTDSSVFTNGIYVESAVNAVIDNNRIASTDKEYRPRKSTAIHLGNVMNQLVEYNEIKNLTNGIRILNNANDTKIGKNIISNTLQSIQVIGEANSSIRKLKIANNIFTSSEVAISLLPDGGIIRKTFVSNNVFNDYSVAAMEIVQPGMGKIEIWNNIFTRGKQGKSFIADVFTYDDPPLSIASMDYNLFAEQPLFLTGLYSNNRRLFSLKVWQEFSEQDGHSVVSTVTFRNPGNNDFRLAKKSRNVIKGTVDGKPSSRRVEVGAYTTAIKQIGMARRKTAKHSAAKQARTSTKVAKKMVSTIAVTKAPKPTAKLKSEPDSKINKKSEGTKPAQVAMVRTGERDSIADIEIRNLEWEVDRRLQFGGKCVLESNKIDFFDGYDNTGLKFRVLNNELYLLTKSNIDMSFNDVGLQVGTNEFLHADDVVLHQNAVITKEMPKLITQLRKSSKARVQIRFWPSYPATRAYSEVVTLDGFLPAYQAYKDCQGGN